MKRLYAAAAVITLLTFLVGIWQARDSRVKFRGISDGVCDGNQVYLIDSDEKEYHIIHTKRSGFLEGSLDVPKLTEGFWDSYRYLTLDHEAGKEGEPGLTAYVYQYRESMESTEKKSNVLRCDFQKEKLEPVWQLPAVRLHGISVVDGVLYYAAPEDETDLDSPVAFYSMDQEENRTLLGVYDFPYSRTVRTYYNRKTKTAMWSDYNGKIYYNGEEIPLTCKDQNDHVHIALCEEGTILTDLEENAVELIPPGGENPGKLFSLDSVELEDLGLLYSDLLPFDYDTDKNWTAGIYDENGDWVLGIFDRTGKRLQVIAEGARPAEYSFEKGLKRGALCFLGLSVVCGLVYAFLRRTGGLVPIVAELLLILIPVILLCGSQLNNQIRSSFQKRVIRMEENLLYEIADQFLSSCNPRDIEKIDIGRVPYDPYYKKMFSQEDFMQPEKALYTADGSRFPVTVTTYHWLYLMKEGDLRYVIVDDNYYGGKVSYYRDRDQMEIIQKAMTEQKVIASGYQDQEGSWVVLYVPVYGSDGNAIGVMESGMKEGVILYEVGQEVRELYTRIAVIMGILCGLLVLVLTIALHPLSRLRAAVEAMALGNLGVTVKQGGRDEVAAISAAFNHMSLKIQQQMEYISACSKGYEKFVPKRIFELLEREDITRVMLGDQREIKAAVLTAGAGDLRGLERGMTGEELYAMINRIMGLMIPAVSAHDGMVDRMDDAGLTAVYPGGSRDALYSAIAVCENFREQEKHGEILPAFQLSITFGTVKIGVVGQEERAAASSISDIIPLGKFLMELGRRYGANIVIEGNASKEIEGFETLCHCRFIGYLHRKQGDSLSPLFDIYDGDEAGLRRLKEETKELFSQALSDYLGGRYYEARQKFARILGKNREDKAAREYIYRCDKYYRVQSGEKAPVWLEEYG